METLNLTLCRATRSGRIDRAYLGGLTVEQIVVKWDDGEALPEGTKLALYQGETLCAAADLDAAGAATLSTGTQEIADAFQGLPVDYALNFRIFIGDDDSILAIVPVKVKKNWLDGGSHPPAPIATYWTREQTQAAIAEATRFGGESIDILNEDRDNWSAAWGFRLDLRTLKPDAFPVPGQAGARVLNIQLVSSSKDDSFADPKTVRLRIEASDGTAFTSSNAHAFDAPLKWCNFSFASGGATGAWLPDATLTARFVDADTGEDAAVPLRLGPVETQPEGNSLIVSADGAGRTDLIPYLNTLKFVPVGPTFADAIQALATGKQDALLPGANITIEDGVISATGVDPTTSARIAALEQGRGIYKDPKTGKVSLYTPLPECPDGTLKVIMDLGFGTKILPVEEADSVTDIGCFDDGQYLFLFNGTGELSTAWGYRPSIYVYDINLNRVCRKKGSTWFGVGEDLRFMKDWSAFFHVYGDYIFFQRNDGRLAKMDLQYDTTPIKTVTKPADNPIALWHNPLTGHLCHLSRTSAGVWHIRVYDDDLNAVAGEDGQPLIIDVTDVCVSAKLQGPTRGFTCQVGVKHIYGRAYVFSATSLGGAILQAQADDSLAILREATVQEDPDNPGKVLCEKQANGTPVRDDPSLNVLKRPVTTPGPEIRFNTPVAAEREYTANAWHGMPRFYLQNLDQNWVAVGPGHNCWMLTDGLDTWYILSDGRAIRCDQYQIPWTGVNSLPNYTATPLKGIQDCLTNAKPTAAVPLFMAGVGGTTWGTNSGIALFASDAQFGDKNGFTQNIALRVKTNQTSARNVTTDGLLPFWPRFNVGVVNNAHVGSSGNAFVGCPVWYVNFYGIAERGL